MPDTQSPSPMGAVRPQSPRREARAGAARPQSPKREASDIQLSQDRRLRPSQKPRPSQACHPSKHQPSSKDRRDIPKYCLYEAVYAGCMCCVRHWVEEKQIEPCEGSDQANCTAIDWAKHGVDKGVTGCQDRADMCLWARQARLASALGGLSCAVMLSCLHALPGDPVVSREES